MLTDLFVSKMVFRFAGGGTNWLVLKLQKGGLGIIMGLAGKMAEDSGLDSKRIAVMSKDEISQTLGKVQQHNDEIARGTAGLLVNAALLLIAKAAFDWCEKPAECEERKEDLLNWMERNRWSNKYINNIVPFYLTGYIAWEKQKRMGIEGMANMYRYSPARAYAYNLFNQREDSQTEKLVKGIGNIYDEDEEKQEKGKGEMGEILGQYFNINPVPYRIFKDAYTLAHGMQGNIKQTYIKPRSVWEGYLKFGISDWPVLGKEDDE